MLSGCKGILDHILNVEIRPDLVEVLSQVDDFCVGKHDELHAGGRFVVMKLVLAGAIGEKGIVIAAELGDQVAQGEDEPEDELLVVRLREGLADGGSVAIEPDCGRAPLPDETGRGVHRRE
jgi:hypothetical protein